MKKIIKTMLIVLLIALIIIQFFRPVKNANAEIAENQITAKNHVPENVQNMLKASCYDCHSNTTIYPWYWKVQPVAWFLNNHIKDGKRHLNFSEFSTFPAWKRYKNFNDISREVKSGDMPLYSYTIIHRNTSLNAAQSLAIENWAANSMKEMENLYPADSLKRANNRDSR